MKRETKRRTKGGLDVDKETMFERMFVEHLYNKECIDWVRNSKALWSIQFPKLGPASQTRILYVAIYLASNRSQPLPKELLAKVKAVMKLKASKAVQIDEQRLAAAKLITSEPGIKNRAIARRLRVDESLVRRWLSEPVFRRLLNRLEIERDDPEFAALIYR
jgi:hypothetical protein